MTDDAKEVFTAYFGDPINVYIALAILLFICLILWWMIAGIKAFKERGPNKSDAEVWLTLFRGMALVLIVVAVFMSI